MIEGGDPVTFRRGAPPRHTSRDRSSTWSTHSEWTSAPRRTRVDIGCPARETATTRTIDAGTVVVAAGSRQTDEWGPARLVPDPRPDADPGTMIWARPPYPHPLRRRRAQQRDRPEDRTRVLPDHHDPVHDGRRHFPDLPV